jgi:hypothetical protein
VSVGIHQHKISWFYNRKETQTMLEKPKPTARSPLEAQRQLVLHCAANSEPPPADAALLFIEHRIAELDRQIVENRALTSSIAQAHQTYIAPQRRAGFSKPYPNDAVEPAAARIKALFKERDALHRILAAATDRQSDEQ